MKDRISADWIAVDWGTSSLRAWAMADAGTHLAEAASADGMGKLTPDEFEPALLRLIGSWLPDNSSQPIPVIACGMVGARQGWVEAAYRPVPCPPAGLPFTSPVTADSRMSVQIIPGLSQNPPPDVMRGEETQIAGLLHRYPAFEGVACLPGTHTKWAEIADGAVNSFRTFMTGELFDLLSRQSVLRHGMGGDGWSAGAFADGVEQALGDPAGIAGASFMFPFFSLPPDAMVRIPPPDGIPAAMSEKHIIGSIDEASTRK